MVIMLAMVDRPEHKFNVDKADGVSRRHSRPELTLDVDKVILFGTPSFGLVKAWIFQLPIL